MYLTTLDILAVIIALVVSVTLVVTTALANRRLDESRRYWRRMYQEARDDYDYLAGNTQS